jgi:hypothetical protein
MSVTPATRVPNALDRFWLAPAPARRLATLRVLCGLFSVIYLLVRAPVMISFGRLSAAQFEPVGLAYPLSAPLPAALTTALWALCVATGVAFTLGLRFRYSGPAFGILFLWVTSYRNSWGMIFHNDNLTVLHALVLGLCPASAEALALDARGKPVPADAGRYGWPIKLLCAAAAASYLLAGVAKMRGAGVSWAGGDVLRNYIAYDAMRKIELGSIHSPLGAWLVRYAWPFPFISALSLALELGAPLSLLHRRLGKLWALGMWGFHLGVLLLMAIVFPYPLTVGLVPFFDAERMWHWRPLQRVARWLELAPSQRRG